MTTNNYPGSPFPLGATPDDHGVNFAIYSENATRVELCLFDEESKETRIELKERYHQIWHGYIPGLANAQLYGYRMYGPYEPQNGKRFNPDKLLIDPYAKAISGTVKWHPSLYAYNSSNPEDETGYNEEDSAAFVPKSVVIQSNFDWQDDKALRIPYESSVIYELHVKGFSKLHTGVPEELRGTYEGLAHPASIQYLKELGITAVELMPVHHFVADQHLEDKGLTNYWGYNTIAFLAPDVRYCTCKTPESQVDEFKMMVRELHKAGIEVIMDVVYNHTAEGNHLGPTLSFRGIDNESYYRLTEDKQYYMDYTGTGNTLNTQLPSVLRLIMDSLRYWITEMHVDGFRFDLAAALARELHDVNRLSSFFDIIYQDPVISQVKLIAEPWDVGEGGYQVGNFPPGWAEWNGKYRDCIRDYWRGSDSMLAEFAERFTGSADLYQNDYRRPTASINLVTAHDGFTLHDLVSYNDKHNEANKEDNKDGENNNRSWNCGAEGDTDNQDITRLRNQQKRNLLATLFLSQGVPMLVAGDEIGRTQKGNNNAYCQDNEISWLHWDNSDKALLDFTKKLVQLRKKHPIFCRRRWFRGTPIEGNGIKDVSWFLPEGQEMSQANWDADFAKSLAIHLNGYGLNYTGPEGERMIDDNFYVIFNAYSEPITYQLPAQEFGSKWTKILDTSIAQPGTGEGIDSLQAGESLTVAGRSVVVLINPRK